ncbi:SAM-dependent methyltransferase [Glycomyces paridis]|uniref:SAM-dependent methyltransferase n=1 Tax=Glycomyces paridis TaxID=2126555 RepID=A0A4S8PJS6_9ACTN|nr:SAM-dependent methyltransferase [Glycomyces paridis]THV30251.1 hypothetical protein E9998_07750 [Glycomyces paridis]
MGYERWSTAMNRALYGPGGFYRRERPRDHFTTSARHPAFAEALARLVTAAFDRLGRPEDFTVVDVGADTGDLLARLSGLEHWRLVGVDLRPRPEGLPERIVWRPEPPERFTGVLLACELLDNVPCDVAVVAGGERRYEAVNPEGATRPGARLDAADEAWLDRWWPIREDGERAEIGRPRDDAWRALTARLVRGTALAVDYGHTRSARPEGGTMTGFRNGRAMAPVPDGSMDLTAHVAVDAIECDHRERQSEALRALGLTTARPALTQAYEDPAGYAAALARASAAATLTDNTGLGAHWWLRTDR